MLSTKTNQYLSYHKDGMQDFFIGLGISFAGIFIQTERVWMAGIFIPVLLPALQSARRRLLQPRIGELDDPQQARSQQTTLITTLVLGLLALAGVGMFFVFGMTSGPVNDWVRSYFLLIIGSVFGTTWALAALTLKIRRHFIYGLLTFAILATCQFTGLEFWVGLTTLGVLVALTGCVLLIRFLQDHPIIHNG